MATLSNDQIKKNLHDLKDWTYDEPVIKKTFEFDDFREAFSKMTAIAFIAEGHQHHPDWKNSYNTLEISLTSHDQGGITEEDFKMAREIEKVV